MTILYNICSLLQKLTLRSFADYSVLGAENVPPYGPLIIVSNHMSNIDPSILSASIDRRLKFLAKNSIFVGFPISQMLYAYGAHPIDREKADLGAIRWAKLELGRDTAMVIFPEGTRNNGEMIKAKDGAVRLIQMTKATVLPVGITGTERHRSVLRVVNPTGQIRVNIGTPFSLPPLDGTVSDAVMRSMTTMIMERIAYLLPNEYRGYYSLSRTATTRKDSTE